MTQIDFKSLNDLSPFELKQYIDDHHFTNEQKVQIFEHYYSTHKDITNIYSRKENIKSIKKDVDYVHMFTKNFQQLAELDISKNELKVIARILNIMEFGNCFHISQAKLCRDLDIKKSNMSLVFKKLKKKGIIIDKDGDLFMNSNIFLKGQAHSINAKQRPNVKKAQGFVVDEKERFENVYTFRTNSDESNEMDSNSEPSKDNEDLKLQPPKEMPKYLFEETE
ncbi:DNA-binding protein [Salmonella enterica]|uniref:DNA-binding protein n=1 Tax=Salmonella enterica TaxID=28901 RepID=UPI00127D390F|nr:DNA-binding protein [Salmonella enterica]EDV0905503.1 DNA-binding protein [Salmonella enterica subsp. salamae]EHM1753487.1 DNA-binding protein [Salmonella enterica subsp. salamae serovar 40:c:e,n,x,z15]EDH0696559.1 DNA-binding protein [Salmonella enterica]EIU8983822.1 DNA-binding protein [Salmonella enterica]MCU7097173.1 DNA-binding protein [Salmonella enterica]